MNSEKLCLYASEKSWIEGEALRQLERVAQFAGMIRVAGFPDLHPGKGSPVGAAMLTKDVFYPYLIGSDIGCGMGLFATELSASKGKPEKWSRIVGGLDEPWNGDVRSWLEEHNARPEGFADALGTIGHGNHFAELLRVHEIRDSEKFSRLPLDKSRLILLVHSGSRGLGESILRSHVNRFKDGGLYVGSDDADAYLSRHNNALAWAKANRELIAYRLLAQLKSDYKPLIDLIHNSITPISDGTEHLFLHRKGAAPSDSGPVIVPGSRGALSYLVMPTGDQKANLWSIAHGAGRKWGRAECERRLRERFSADSLRRTKMGNYVICDDKNLLYEEAPQAYKDIDVVIDQMVSFGLISVIASFSPVLTYKVRQLSSRS